MKQTQGFAIYGLVLVIACASLIATVYGIQLRAREFLFYKELAKQRTAGYGNENFCGGPEDKKCPPGFVCDADRSMEDSFGSCKVSY